MLVKIQKYLANELIPVSERQCFGCFNNSKICPCNIYSGNSKLPNLFNKKFPVYEKIIIKEPIYEAKL